MKAIKNITLAALLAALSTVTIPAGAQAMDHSKMHGTGASAPAAEMTEGEIKKVDKDNKKLTIKHGEIRNLDMPAMTMVFQVKDATLLDKVKAGDKIRFVAEKSADGYVVTDVQAAN